VVVTQKPKAKKRSGGSIKPAAIIPLLEEFIQAAKDAETVVVPMPLAVAILQNLKRQGRKRYIDKVALLELTIIAEALARKAESIINNGMPKGKAGDLAVAWAQAEFLKVGRPLSAETIKRWMEGRLWVSGLARQIPPQIPVVDFSPDSD
jgi:hypothetical protein